ncbi:DEAD/DEAH box helicase [Dysgonomonas termitidis]|uniref:Uncharacterized protein n=1 Tax=Dysgonomonas termitidis TaxID=1516126 RepID=A0ABV9KSW8_9BACT
MEYLLEKLRHRIKGAAIYQSPSGTRLYIPYSLDCPYPVTIKVFFEVINARLQLFVRIRSDVYNESWCDREAEQIKGNLNEQLYEILHDCELQCRNIPLHLRLRDNTSPFLSGASQEERDAVRFLCTRKAAALISESRSFRWSAAIGLAGSRRRAGQIRRLFIFLPHADIEPFKEKFFSLWEDLFFPVFLVPIESLSHNIRRYQLLAADADPATMVIIDSCHLFKSPQSVRSRRMEDITDRCNYKLIMTESMIVGNIHDVYMQYNLLSRLILRYYRWEDFARMHIIYGGYGGTQILGYKNLAYLVEKVKPYTYYREIRPESQPDQPVKTICCELTEKQRYYYSRKKNELLTMIEKNELGLYDVFRIFIQLQKIVCGFPLARGCDVQSYDTNKLPLLKEHLEDKSIIFCKFLFEIDLLRMFLGADNCAVIGNRGKGCFTKEKEQFMLEGKKYLISTLYFPDFRLSDIRNFSQILFFSLSFRYADYRRCFTYIEDCGMAGNVPVKRFVTNSGIDRAIVSNLQRKGKLAYELKQSLSDKSELIHFIKSL